MNRSERARQVALQTGLLPAADAALKAALGAVAGAQARARRFGLWGSGRLACARWAEDGPAPPFRVQSGMVEAVLEPDAEPLIALVAAGGGTVEGRGSASPPLLHS